jgi:hypothetical protein
MSAEVVCGPITSDANTDVSNAEAAATPPPQLPTQHASNFQVPVFFFLFQICEGGGVGHHSQEDLAKFGYRSENKVKTF